MKLHERKSGYWFTSSKKASWITKLDKTGKIQAKNKGEIDMYFVENN